MRPPPPPADTPGLFAPIHDYRWDSRVVSFTLLASSLLLYNSFRTVDQAAIKTLADVGELAELYAGVSSGTVLNRGRSMAECLSSRVHVPRVSGGATPDTSLFIPKLLWVIRDSELALVDKKGNSITPTQWYVPFLPRVCVVCVCVYVCESVCVSRVYVCVMCVCVCVCASLQAVHRPCGH